MCFKKKFKSNENLEDIIKAVGELHTPLHYQHSAMSKQLEDIHTIAERIDRNVAILLPQPIIEPVAITEPLVVTEPIVMVEPVVTQQPIFVEPVAVVPKYKEIFIPSAIEDKKGGWSILHKRER